MQRDVEGRQKSMNDYKIFRKEVEERRDLVSFLLHYFYDNLSVTEALGGDWRTLKPFLFLQIKHFHLIFFSYFETNFSPQYSAVQRSAVKCSAVPCDEKGLKRQFEEKLIVFVSSKRNWIEILLKQCNNALRHHSCLYSWSWWSYFQNAENHDDHVMNMQNIENFLSTYHPSFFPAAFSLI